MVFRCNKSRSASSARQLDVRQPELVLEQAIALMRDVDVVCDTNKIPAMNTPPTSEHLSYKINLAKEMVGLHNM